jgi:DNA-binding LacI/PurR family transcriptional regulator
MGIQAIEAKNDAGCLVYSNCFGIICVRLHLELPRFLVVRILNLLKKVIFVHLFLTLRKPCFEGTPLLTNHMVISYNRATRVDYTCRPRKGERQMSVTRDDVARLAGVSSATVSYVVNNGPRPVSEETRKKVQKAIEILRYQPSSIARSLKTKRTTTIGLVVSDILNPVVSGIAKGIEDCILERGWNMILCNSDEDPERELRFLKMLVSKQADGIILQPTGGNIDFLDLLVNNRKIPVILLDRQLKELSVDCILFENEEGTYQATRHLIDMGHKRIALITLPRDLTPGFERVAGYVWAHEEAGIQVDPMLITEGSFKADTQVMKETLFENENPPTALLACSNRLCASFLRYAKERNIRIPQDLALAVFDDISYYSYITPSITAVAVDIVEFGQEAGQLLIDRINCKKEVCDPKIVRLPCTLMVRESTSQHSRKGVATG